MRQRQIRACLKMMQRQLLACLKMRQRQIRACLKMRQHDSLHPCHKNDPHLDDSSETGLQELEAVQHQHYLKKLNISLKDFYVSIDNEIIPTCLLFSILGSILCLTIKNEDYSSLL